MKKVVMIMVCIVLMFSFIATVEAAKKPKFYRIAFLVTIERAPTVAAWKEFDVANTYEDAIIAISWKPGPSVLGFDLTNNTSNSMSLIWDECAFVDQNGKVHKTRHAGIKYIDRNNPMTPSLVPAKGKISELLYPFDYMYYSNTKYSRGWKSPDIFRERIKGKQTYDPATSKWDIPFTPESFKSLLMVQTQGKKYLYTFTFRTYEYMKMKKVEPEIPEVFPIAIVTNAKAAPGEK
jgi:hypothetical protein